MNGHSAAALIIRMMFASVFVLVVAIIGVFGFLVLEPFYGSFGEPPSSLGWSSPGTTNIAMVSFAFIALLMVVVIWLIAAPIQQDRRQQIR